MAKDRDFALLVGKAFLNELNSGHTESAIAFGRAFLLSLGMRGPDGKERMYHNGHKAHGVQTVLAEN